MSKNKNSGMSKKELLKQEEIRKHKSSFQNFIPIIDIKNGCFRDRFGKYLPVILIGSKNLDLMSKEDKYNLQARLEEVYLSIKAESYQISIIPMPYDISEWNANMSNFIAEIVQEKSENLSNYGDLKTEWEKKKSKEEKTILESRLTLMTEEKDWVTEKVQTGSLSSKKCFMILEFDEVDDVRTAVMKANEVIDRFRQKDIEVRLTSERELRDLLNILCNPLNTSVKELQRINLGPVFNTYEEDEYE